MTIRGYIAFMLAGSAIAWLAWYVVLGTVDPFTAGLFGIGLFYGSLGLAVLGTLTLLIFVVRTMTHREELPVRNLGIAIREAFWGVAFLMVVLMLLRRGMLAWWNVMPLILALGIMEYIFLAFRRRVHQGTPPPSRPPLPPIRTIQ